jgi:uncharacterized protein (TIGR02145 family)/uncharacterized repeat protein (TIGR02543 family)
MTVTFTPKTSGARLIRVSVSDGSLLDTARIHIAVVERDSVAPVIRLVNQKLDSSATNTSYAVIECIVTDNKAIDSVVISSGGVVFPIKNNNDSFYNAEVNGLQAGVFTTIVIRAIDKGGNATSRTVHIKYDPTMADRQKPQIILLAPLSPTVLAAATVIAKVKDASGVAEVKINGTAVTSTDSFYTRQITLATGDNSVTVYAKDASTNANDTTVTFAVRYEPTAVDTNGPKIRLLSPADNTTLTATPATVRVVLTDPSGIASASINGVTVTSADSVYSTSVTLVDGTNPIQVTAQDNGYNHKTSSIDYNLKLDLPPAVVTVNAPSGITKNGMTITWNASNANDFTLYKVFYATTPNINEQSTLAASINAKVNTSCALTLLPVNTAVYCKVYVCDNLSCVASAEVTATTLPDPPAITTSPSSSTKCIGEAVTFTAVAVGVPPLHYQWKRGATDVGTDQASYPIAAIAAGDAGSYTCTISNAGGSATSTPATLLTVNTPSTKATGATANPTSVIFGGSSTLVVADGILGTNAEWKWYKEGCGTTLVGSGPSIKVTPIATTTYYVRAEGVCGNTECVTVQVIFNPTYIVTFDDQGATSGRNPPPINVTVPDTAVGSLPTQPIKTSYVFDGWYTEKKGSGTVFTARTKVIADVKVYANWVIKDYDGNTYHEVIIGSQTWMVENLKTTHYRDGVEIHYETDPAKWQTDNYIPEYCWYNNDTINKATYGALYNWNAVKTGLLAPAGWHVPDTTDFRTLETTLGGFTIAGGKLKEAGLEHWITPNTDATNESGFTGLPGGLNYYGTFRELGKNGSWWSSTASDASTSYSIGRQLNYNQSSLDGLGRHQCNGYSVRLIRDY